MAWPTDADLADRLGLAAGDDTARVTAANAAATADAVAVCRYRRRPPGLTTPASSRLSCCSASGGMRIATDPKGLDSLNPMASPYYRRVAIGILQRGQLPVA